MIGQNLTELCPREDTRINYIYDTNKNEEFET